MTSLSETAIVNDTDLENAILCGLRNACELNKEFNKFGYADLKPEYLLTCNVAESILRQFPDLIIKLEDNSRNFIENSLTNKSDLMKYFETLTRWKIFSGRIDIGLYNEDRQAICPIEVKLVNPQETKIKKDIKRVLSCLDNESNLNLVKMGYFVFVRQPMKCFARSEMERHVNETKEWIENYIQNNFQGESSNFDFYTKTESVWDDFRFHDYDEMDGMDPLELGEELKESIHFVGVVIRISAKNGSTQQSA